ncbi:hypothetical protein AOC05_02920 [Arthrobacter alpinus]|uniref:Uncharacterized protein n=1 Tax=Arthrobacter alpinus TaxID=656366 RepID=A0A0M4RMY4_9MICC|nr:hypothetical protein [Arthrobacter alpinus]ALE91538.1 hypothetical protein AOC05_02920 [Arthrobacter alpinus]
MNPQEPQESGPSTKDPATRTRRSLRDIPGFTFAAVAFVLVVVLGVGGTAIANWNQSTTATIAITAGAAPTPTPKPTVPPTTPPTTPPTAPPTPPAGPSNVVASPVFATRPTAIQFPYWGLCTPDDSDQQNARFTFTWTGGKPNTTGYVVTLMSVSGTSYNQTQIVDVSQATFSMKRGFAGTGNFILRVQPMNGGTAGDPSYKTVTLNYFYSSTTCWVTYDQEPLPATLTVSTVPPAPRPTDNAINLSWTAPAGGATSYVVSIKSDNSTYGTEFPSATLGTTLTFPPRVLNANGKPAAYAAFYGNYTLRIQPMNGTTPGDPVYKDIQYMANKLVMLD